MQEKKFGRNGSWSFKQIWIHNVNFLMVVCREFSLLPQLPQKMTLKSGQNRLKNNHLAVLIYIHTHTQTVFFVVLKNQLDFTLEIFFILDVPSSILEQSISAVSSPQIPLPEIWSCPNVLCTCGTA